LIEAGSEPHAQRRQGKTGRAECESLLQSDSIDHRARSGGADCTSDQGAPRCPANTGGIQLEAQRQIMDGAAYDDVVVTKQQAAQRRHRGGDDERAFVREIWSTRSGSQDCPPLVLNMA